MVFNASWVAAVATLSADLCQHVACNPERLPSGEVLYLLFCLPLQHVGRLALRLFSFFCFPVGFRNSPAARFRRWPAPSSSSSSSSSSDDSDDDYTAYDSLSN